jgi:hypothetical protein
MKYGLILSLPKCNRMASKTQNVKFGAGLTLEMNSSSIKATEEFGNDLKFFSQFHVPLTMFIAILLLKSPTEVIPK